MKISSLLFSSLLFIVSSITLIPDKAWGFETLCKPVYLGEIGVFNNNSSYYADGDQNPGYTLKLASTQYVGSNDLADPFFLIAWVSPPSSNSIRKLEYLKFNGHVNSLSTCSVEGNATIASIDDVQWVKEGGFVKKGYLYSQFNSSTPYLGNHGYVAVSSRGREPINGSSIYKPHVNIYRMFGPVNGSAPSELELVLADPFVGMYPEMAQANLAPRFTFSDLNYFFCDDMPNVYYDYDFTPPSHLSCKLTKSNVVNMVVYVDDVEYISDGSYDQEQPGNEHSAYWQGHVISYKMFDPSGKILSEGYIPESYIHEGMVLRPEVIWNEGIERFVVQWTKINQDNYPMLDVTLRSATIGFTDDGNGNMITDVKFNNNFKYTCGEGVSKKTGDPNDPAYFYINQGCQIVPLAYNKDIALSDDGHTPVDYDDMNLFIVYGGDPYGIWADASQREIAYYAKDVMIQNPKFTVYPGSSNIEPVYNFEYLDLNNNYNSVIYSQLIKTDGSEGAGEPAVLLFGKPVVPYFDDVVVKQESVFNTNEPNIIMNLGDVALGINTARDRTKTPVSAFVYTIKDLKSKTYKLYFGATKWVQTSH